MKVFGHMTSYRADLSFDAWFTRILVNACLDRLKARSRAAPLAASRPATRHDARRRSSTVAGRRAVARAPAAGGRRVAGAVGRGRGSCPTASATVFTLCHLDEQPPLEIAAALGMSPATVRVHLFRALRKLRNGAGRPAMTRPVDAHLDDDTLRLLALDPAARRRRRRRRTWRRARAARAAAAAAARELDELRGRRRRALTDAAFSAADLERQRQRRFSPGSAAATAWPGCCAFPGHEPARLARRVQIARWLAVAAAAGLVLGVLAGQLPHLLATRPAGRTGPPPPGPPPRSPAPTGWRSRTRCSAKWKPRSTPTRVPSSARSTR